MKIQEINIKKFRNLENIRLDITNSWSKPREKTLLVGINGSGKSSIIEIISNFLDYYTDPYPIAIENIFCDDNGSIDIEIEYLDENDEIQFWKYKRDKIENKKYTHEFLVKEDLKCIVNNLYLENISKFEKITESFNKIIYPRKVDLSNIEYFSSGYKQILKILIQLDKYYKEGIILLDDIDLNLHPYYQRKVLGLLMSLLNRNYIWNKENKINQYIITTHSIFVKELFFRDEIIELK